MDATTGYVSMKIVFLLIKGDCPVSVSFVLMRSVILAMYVAVLPSRSHHSRTTKEFGLWPLRTKNQSRIRNKVIQ